MTTITCQTPSQLMDAIVELIADIDSHIYLARPVTVGLRCQDMADGSIQYTIHVELAP